MIEALFHQYLRSSLVVLLPCAMQVQALEQQNRLAAASAEDRGPALGRGRAAMADG